MEQDKKAKETKAKEENINMEKEENIIKEYEEIWGEVDVFIISICSFTDAYLCQNLSCCTFKICSLLAISYTSIKCF